MPFSLIASCIVQLLTCGANTALGRTMGTVSSHHREAVRSACHDMYPSKKLKRMKCEKKMLENAGPLLDPDDVPANQRDYILQHCEGLKYNGDGEDRLKKYDSCLREFSEDVAPEKIPLPPKLAIKPYILLDISNCDDFPDEAVEALNTYKYKLEEYLKSHVRGIVFLEDNFITDFWCTKKKLYFENAQKKHSIDRQFYAVMLNFEAKAKAKFDLEYELYDIKTRGFIYRGRVTSKPVSLHQSPTEFFTQLKNARNQILNQIIKYDPLS